MTTYTHPVPVAADPHGRNRAIWAPLLSGAAAAALSAYVWAVDPNTPGHYPVCPTYALTGIYCPGCGMLRAAHALLHGDVAGSFAMNLFFPPLALLTVVLLLRWAWARWQGRRITWTPRPWLAWTVLAMTVAFMVARNLPWFPFLRPA